MFTTIDMKTVRNSKVTLWVNGVDKTSLNRYTPPKNAMIEFRSNNGYIINSAYFTFWGVGGSASSPTNKQMVISSDNKIATYTLVDSLGTDYNVGGIVTALAPVASVYMFTPDDVHLITSKNCTLWINNVAVTTSKVIEWGDNLEIRANAGFELENVSFNFNDNIIQWSISSDKKKASNSSNYDGNQLSNLIVNSKVETIKGCFSTAMIKTINDNNCDLVYNGEIVATEKYALIGEKYSIVCRPDWIFNTEPDAVGGYAVYGRYINAGGSYTVDQWEVSEDKKTVTKTLQATRNYVVFNVKTDQDVPIDVLGGVNNVYKVDADIMKALTKERFFMTNTGSNGEFMTFDYGQFILNLMQLPFSIPTDNIIGSEPIQLAKLETTVVAPMVNTDRVTYNLGDITISGNNSNLLDYSTKQAILHLPFSDPVILDNQYIIDETITAKLTINLYTGTGTYNIYSTAIDQVILTKTVSLGVNIPLANFYSSEPNQIVSSSLEWSGDNKLRIAYIELVDTNSDLNSGFFNTPIMDDVVLSEVKGYFTVINANLSLRATSSEKSQIQSMLQGGVIYK